MFYIKHNMEMCICVICDVGHYQAEANSIYANVFLVIMLVFTARCTLVQSAVLRSHVVCLSVCLSVCL